MRHFITFFICVSSLSAAAQPAEVSDLVAKFDQTMVQCPAKIWSNYDWGGKTVVMVYPSQNSSWVWDVDTKTTTLVDNKVLSSKVVSADYNLFEWNGHPALSLNMESISQEAFEFGVHEFFHDQGQKGWTFNGDSRGTSYPVRWEPRAYRRMIYDHLLNYFKSGQDAELRKARYWYEKWTSEFPDEVAATTDGYEGSARYVEAMSLAIVKLGCGASESQLKTEAISIATTNINFTQMFAGTEFQLDAEGYAMGGLASMILRFTNVKLEDWNLPITLGKTPLDLVLAGVNPEIENLPAQIAAHYSAKGQEINEERGILLDKDIVNWTDNQYVRVAIRFSWLQSNFMPLFFARSTALNMDLFPFSQEHRMISADRISNYSVAEKTVGFFDDNSICQGSSVFALVRASDIQENADLMTIRSQTVNGLIKGKIQYQDGFAYLCAVE